MSSDCSITHSAASSSSSSTIIEESAAPVSIPASADHDMKDAFATTAASPPRSSSKGPYLGSSDVAKGKRRASEEDISAPFSKDTLNITSAMSQLSVQSPTSPNNAAASSQHDSISSPSKYASSPPHQPEPERRIRKVRDGASRSVAPSPLRSALTPSPTTGSASQFVSLLGQPVAVSASISAPNKTSAAAASAALPSLYKASRGRSANVSPSRRWDRRGASASVLSGASASGSGGEGDDASDEDVTGSRASPRTGRASNQSSASRDAGSSARLSTRRLSVPKEEALFPSDEDDSPELSPLDELSGSASKVATHRRRSRRWSSIERERSRGMRVLLQDRPALAVDDVTLESTLKRSIRGRNRSVNRAIRVSEEDASDIELSSTPSSCTSSCDLNYVPRGSDTAAIPIRERRGRSIPRSEGTLGASVGAASSQGHVPSSTDGSDDPSPAASTPSTSLVQRSPPGFTALKQIVAIPVASEADPLLGLATPTVEELIEIDQVEFFPEEAITAQLSSAESRRKTSPKHSKKTSWIIGDFESEPESDDEEPSDLRKDASVKPGGTPSTSPSSPSAGSYQARLASLQSQLRIWSRGSDASASPRVRQISSGSEDHTEAEGDAKDADSLSSSLLSASWRNLTRLPNLILLPGLAARQARESLASVAKANSDGHDGSVMDRASPRLSQNDFAQIHRLASSGIGPIDEEILQAQRDAALKTGRPPSPSPSPSPPASLLGSRQSSNDSISTSDKAHQHISSAPRRGRGVATPLEADRDPSAYVSGLGQPIDPDTELSSVVQLQTFRSRSRSRPAGVRHRSQQSEESRRSTDRHSARSDGSDEGRNPLSPKKLGQPIELEPTEDELNKSTDLRTRGREGRSLDRRGSPSSSLTVQIPKPSSTGARAARERHDQFADGPAPTDTASAPTSPTYRNGVHSHSSTSASSENETDSAPSPPRRGEDASSVDADGFRVVRRRNRRRSSGPQVLRPKVEAPVPQGFSAFAIDEGDENAEGSDSDGEVTPSPTRPRRSRGRGRDSSPRRSSRQCAVGLFGGGGSDSQSSSSGQSSSRSRRSSRRDASHISLSTPIRSVRSSPDLTYAAAAAAATARASAGVEDGDAESQDQSTDDPSPPRGSRGRRGAVKVVASSVGQRPSMAQPLPLGGLEGLRRGPSYPPRAVEILDDTDGAEDDSQSALPHGGRGRSVSSPGCGAQAVRFRLLSNSSHLLMLSLELDMIKKQKISAPLKPRWGKHRADDFNPLPPAITYSPCSFSSKYLRSPFSGSRSDSEEGSRCDDADCTPCDEAQQPNDPASPASSSPSTAVPSNVGATKLHPAAISTIGGGLRDPSSRLRFSWSLADIAAALDTAAPTAAAAAGQS